MLSYAAALFHTFITWLVATIGKLGYIGITGLMFLESSCFPFPSEVVMPPAGYLASKGEMDLIAVIFFGILGSILGALFNYWLAVRWGRPFLEKYGKYLFISKESLDKAETFFAKHGHISTFTGRLLPVIRQYISLPAGLARMDMKQFCTYTAIGSGIWVAILALLGYFLGNNETLIHTELKKITIGLIIGCVLLVVIYVIYCRRKKVK